MAHHLYHNSKITTEKEWTIYDWCEERLEIQCIADDILSKYVPPHVNIFYCFGGIVSCMLLLQVVTGISLTMVYSATVISAFTSVSPITYHTHLGWTIRTLHRWCGSSMVCVLIQHVTHTYLTGGLKRPRELIWVTGIILAVIIISFGVTGYTLPWDQLGYWACKIVTLVPEALDILVPGIGLVFVLMLRGGFSIRSGRLSRLYSIHTFLPPIISSILMTSHFSMLRKQGISGPL